MKKSYFRPEVDKMQGYVPGEQPELTRLVKLNTNENPYPPSPHCLDVLKNFDLDRLRRYPAPTSDELRDAIAELWGLSREEVIVGNGSDDILTMIFRSFTSPELALATSAPTYSLYPVLAAMQGAKVIEVPLNEDFSLPDDFVDSCSKANLLAIARPNAPTGKTIPMAQMENICKNFDGIVMIDEAYADFAQDNCIDFVRKFDNVIISRTSSKSYSLAGARLGYAVANPQIIEGMMKIKDSYNVDAVTQAIGLCAIKDQDYLKKTLAKVIKSRDFLLAELKKRNFRVIKSETNFLFASPPNGDGEALFKHLREHSIIVRYFPGEVTGKYVRISIGTDEQMQELLQVIDEK